MGLLDLLAKLATLQNGHCGCGCADCERIRAEEWEAMRARRAAGAPAETALEMFAEARTRRQKFNARMAKIRARRRTTH